MLKDLERIVKQFDNDDWKYVNDAWANQFFTHDNYVKSVHNVEMQKKDEVIQEKDKVIQEKDEVIQATIKNLYAKHFTIEEISNITKLSIETIESIINNN